jgi:hypothetical protein
LILIADVGPKSKTVPVRKIGALMPIDLNKIKIPSSDTLHDVRFEASEIVLTRTGSAIEATV